MFRHLLVPLDGSRHAEQALPVAALLAHASQGTITLVQVIETARKTSLSSSPEPLDARVTTSKSYLEQLLELSVSSQHLQAAQEKLRKDTLAQLYLAEGQYSRATRYLAFLLVKYGRGGVIVGNPSHMGKSGAPQALPYTGLEG